MMIDTGDIAPEAFEAAGYAVAPFTPSQVAALIARQGDRSKHPYTCDGEQETCKSRMSRNLRPGPNGWFSSCCNYRQDWADIADTIPPPGIIYSQPHALSDGYFLAETMSPRKLLYPLSQPPYAYTRKAVPFRLIMSRTGRSYRRLPWFKGRKVPSGRLDLTSGMMSEYGDVYIFDAQEVRAYILSHWSDEIEEIAEAPASERNAIAAALYDLEEELKTALEALNVGNLPSMPGTDRRLIEATKSFVYADMFGDYGLPIYHRYITPRLLEKAINGPVKPLAVRFHGPDVPRRFPWFPPAGIRKKYKATYPDPILFANPAETCFSGPTVAEFLRVETNDHIESAARRTLYDALSTKHGRDFIKSITVVSHARSRLPQGE